MGAQDGLDAGTSLSAQVPIASWAFSSFQPFPIVAALCHWFDCAVESGFNPGCLKSRPDAREVQRLLVQVRVLQTRTCTVFLNRPWPSGTANTTEGSRKNSFRHDPGPSHRQRQRRHGTSEESATAPTAPALSGRGFFSQLIEETAVKPEVHLLGLERPTVIARPTLHTHLRSVVIALVVHGELRRSTTRARACGALGQAPLGCLLGADAVDCTADGFVSGDVPAVPIGRHRRKSSCTQRARRSGSSGIAPRAFAHGCPLSSASLATARARACMARSRSVSPRAMSGSVMPRALGMSPTTKSSVLLRLLPAASAQRSTRAATVSAMPPVAVKRRGR